MTSLKAIIKDRRIELAAPLEWPDGTEVEIHPVGQPNNGSIAMSPEDIARTLAAMDKVEPLEMTEAEEAAWQAERRARIEREKQRFADHAEELRRQWE